eukprot:scaffold2050_cov167-Amphora_coffeaeformis.AAC.2
MQASVYYEFIHPDSDLGPMCRIRWTWINDASPELYELGFLRQGPRYEDTVDSQQESSQQLRKERAVALVYAFSTSNDGEPWSGPDREAALVSFRPPWLFSQYLRRTCTEWSKPKENDLRMK